MVKNFICLIAVLVASCAHSQFAPFDIRRNCELQRQCAARLIETGNADDTTAWDDVRVQGCVAAGHRAMDADDASLLSAYFTDCRTMLTACGYSFCMSRHVFATKTASEMVRDMEAGESR